MKTSSTAFLICGALFSLAAAVGATALACFIIEGRITFPCLWYAQKTIPVLWLVDFLPFALTGWGWYRRRITAFKKQTLQIDQTEKEKAKTKVLIDRSMRQVLRDPLTGLPNRFLFRDHLELGMKSAIRNNSKLAVLMLDLDGFKEVNNTLGHFNGDLLLRAVAMRLAGALRKSDTLARFGGDEYAILLPEINRRYDLDVISKKIQKTFDSPFVLEGIHLDVHASAGAVLFPEHGQDADTLLKKADVAMCLAKSNNRRFSFYDPETDRHNAYRLTLMGELRSAINDDDLMLHYQPKVDLRQNAILGAEALVRWTHKDHGVILPDEFISVAERTDLINPLFLWVAHRCCRQAAFWRRSGSDLSVSVNLSTKNLLDPNLPDVIENLPAIYEVLPQKIIFEITETAIMSDPELALSVVSRISEMGFKFSIDDFGTGYSSFGYLAKLPVNEIKIDKSFVMDMLKNETNYIIVYTAIEMAHNLGLKVVAEGVESKEIFDELHLMGCDMAQGYFISKPLPSHEFNEWLNSSEYA